MNENATAKNDVRVILEEFMGKRKAAIFTKYIYEVMEKERTYTYKGEVFYVHKDEVGALVLTMESTVKSLVEKMLNCGLEKDEAQECLKLLMEKQSLCATMATDETIKVEGSDSKIYAKIMKHHPANENEQNFLSLLEEAVRSSVTSFEVPVCDPSIDDNGKLQFVPGFKPAVGYSYNELEKLAKKNELRLGSKFEYVLFLGTIINRLMDAGLSEADAWYAVCTDSKKLGNYRNSANENQCELELTGSRKILGKCDLANTQKILAKDEKYPGFWFTGGCYVFKGDEDPIGKIKFHMDFDCHHDTRVGWFVF